MASPAPDHGKKKKNKQTRLVSAEHHQHGTGSKSKNNAMAKKKKRDHVDTGNVCRFYNAYFDAGCQHGADCSYKHLSASQYTAFCNGERRKNNLSGHASKRFEKARHLMAEGHTGKAFKILRGLVQEYEFECLLNFWMARCYHLLADASYEDLESAQYYYRKAIAISPSNATFHSFYAEFNVDFAKKLNKPIRCSMYKEAKHHFEHSLQLKSSPKVHYIFAKFLDEVEGEYVKAKHEYECALAVITDDTRIRLNYARLLHKMGNFRGSKKQFSHIFNSLKARNPNYFALETRWIWPHFHYARLLIDMQYFDQAHEQLQLCCNIMRKHNHIYYSEIYYEFAKLLFKHFNDNDTAYYYVNLAIEINPKITYYQKLLYKISNLQLMQQQSEQPASSRSSLAPDSSVSPTNDDRKQPGNENEDEEDEEVEYEQSKLRTRKKTGFRAGFGIKAQPQYVKKGSNPSNSSKCRGDQERGMKEQPQEEEEDDFGVDDEGADDQEKEDVFSFHTLSVSKEVSCKQLGKMSERQLDEHENKEEEEKMDDDHEDEEEMRGEGGRGEEGEEEEDDESENEFLANRFCATEFDRYISSDPSFGREFEKYCDKFEEMRINDIRWLLSEQATNESFLRSKIGMNTHSIHLWKKSIEIFKMEHKRYLKWLKTHGFYEKYVRKFKVYGILHLQSFFYHIKNEDDVLYMIGSKNKRDAHLIWRLAQQEASIMRSV
eukprot:CAMPEP_0197073562 /NCGR_PEP_ID=MMETSP1384-20130603/210667_1 /TAXON_ID=29189 /ORGANISM="Ammonia sp." /LENGTH=716 /DNA_ID=CAMNT_0042512399 /DNA_START=253 /DNA_END=2403 /DNA_ORIENTATION=+